MSTSHWFHELIRTDPDERLDEFGRHVLGKAGSLAFTIENVKAAAVEYELEWTAGRRGSEEVDASKRHRPCALARALATATSELSMPSTSKPCCARKITFVPVPQPTSSVRPGPMARDSITSTRSGSGVPVSHGNDSPEV
jgi:hypothetical protein